MINYDIPNSISQYQPQAKLLDISNLDFKPHRSTLDAVQATLDFSNGLYISVVANTGDGSGLYGHVEDDLYEVAIFNDDGMIPLSVSDDVLGWQSPIQVSKHMKDAQVNGESWVNLLKSARVEFRKDLDLD